MNLERVVRLGLHNHRMCVGQLHLLGNRGPIGGVRDDFVAAIEQHHRDVEERLLAAGGHNRFRLGKGHSVIGLVARADGLFEVRGAGHGGVFRKIVIDGGFPGSLGQLRRRKIRFPGAEIHHVHTLTLEFLGVSRHFHGRRHRHTPHPLSQH